MALTLVALVVATVANISTFNPRQKLDETLDNLERAVRFSKDEALLRNRIVRIAIKLNTDPQSFTVEYAPDGEFVLPGQYLRASEASELLSEEALAAKKKAIYKSFQPVKEFAEEVQEISDQIQIIAVASSLTNELVTTDEASIFFYPTGEKDGALIVLSNVDEMATLEVEPFLDEFKRDYFRIESTSNDLYEFQLSQAKSFFEDWLK